MEDYKTLVRDLIEDHISDRKAWDDKLTRKDILEALYDDTENVFGNLDGSRTCSTYEAQQMLQNSGAMFDDDIIDLFRDIEDGYFESSLKRGAETLDVIICELLAPQIISEMLTEGE